MTVRTLTVFGTRPEAIKMAPLVIGLENHQDFESHVCVTAQHREMLDQVLSFFDIQPDFHLDIMPPGQDLHDVTVKVLLGIRDVLRHLKPALVFVHGDTTTCFASALAAFYEDIPVAHIEAGLRTWDLGAPFPEELNRSIVGRFAEFHFAPTQSARDNLLREGVPQDMVWVTGNTVIDALLMATDRIEAQYSEEHWSDRFGEDLFRKIINPTNDIILVTGHRRENFGDGFERICQAIAESAARNEHWTFIYPVHLNPNVQDPVKTSLGELDNVHLIDPLEYESFIWLMNNADVILTDSGGVQEEAPSLGKPVLVMRDVTERPEAVNAGTVKLVGTNQDAIMAGLEDLLNRDDAYEVMSRASNPYGQGDAVPQILAELYDHYHS